MKSTFYHGATFSGNKKVWESIQVIFGNEKSLDYLYGASWIQLAYVYVVSPGEVCVACFFLETTISWSEMSYQLTSLVFCVVLS